MFVFLLSVVTLVLGEPGIGHQAVVRKNVDNRNNINYTYIECSPSMTFTKSGSIKAWRIYSNSPANITLMVARPLEGSDNRFTVVGITGITTTNGKRDFEIIPESDGIRVNAGDVIAWYYVPGSYPSIPWVENYHEFLSSHSQRYISGNCELFLISTVIDTCLSQWPAFLYAGL